MRGWRASIRRAAMVAITAVFLAGCQAAFPARPDPNVPHPYPAGCGDFGLSARRCDFIVHKVEHDLNVAAADVQRVELLDDPGCGQPAGQRCARTVSFVVRVRLTTAAGPQEEMVFCMVGDQFTLICGDHPDIEVGTTSQGYRDTPEGASPVPAIDPDAAKHAQPLHRDTFVVQLDHLGAYDVLVGSAVLPNGILSDASVGSVQLSSPDVVLDGPVFLAVVPEPGRPPFDNVFIRGWHPGTEAVTVRLRFSMSEPPAAGTLTLVDVVVR